MGHAHFTGWVEFAHLLFYWLLFVSPRLFLFILVPLGFSPHIPSSLFLPISSPTFRCFSSPLSSPRSVRTYRVWRRLKPAWIKTRHIKPFTAESHSSSPPFISSLCPLASPSSSSSFYLPSHLCVSVIRPHSD